MGSPLLSTTQLELARPPLAFLGRGGGGGGKLVTE